MARAALDLDPGWRVAFVGAAWLVGVACQLQQRELWPWTAYAIAAAAASAALLVAWAGARGRVRRWAPIAVLALGFMVTGWRAQWVLSDRLSAELEGVDLVLVGVVAQLPQIGPVSTRFQFDVESAYRGPARVAVPSRVSLGWFAGESDRTLLAGAGDDQRLALRAGQRWRLPVRLKRPHGLFNPHGFDLELWLFEQGLRASGTVRLQAAGPQAELLGERVAHPVERARQAVRDAIVARVSDARTAGVLAALAVGDQAAIERDDWDLFRNTGVAHLMSISGLHVTMFAWLAGVLIAWAWRRSPRLMLRWPTPFAARWGGLAVAALYALFAGWGVPAQRTVLMLAAAAAARSLGLNWPWLLVLLMAAVVVTAFDPWALLQPGFWLSFAAVGLLMASEPVFRTPPSGWRAHIVGHLRTQVVATLGLAPLAIVFFQQVSIVGFFANLVAIPLVTLVITPLALAGALVPALWSAGAAVVQALSAILVHLSAWPGAVYTTAAASGWAVACGLLAGVVGLLPWPWRWRVLALPLAAPLLLPTVTRPAPGHFELLAADIGQGNAALVRTRNHLLVYDAGPQFSIDSDAGQRVLLPLLRARGEAQVDLLILSHSDWDHVGGAASLMAGLQVRAWSSSMPDAHPLRTSAVPHQRCEDGQSWTWDGVRFEVLHPTAADYGLDRKPNALSCVLRVEDSAGRGALLTGDIEAAQEAALVARHGAKLRSTLLMVPHHGSRTSSSLVFLDAVDPQSAFAQAGYRSRFGHPAADVVERYRALGIDLVRSDRCGAWTWHDGASECARTTGLRYWHWRDESNQ